MNATGTNVYMENIASLAGIVGVYALSFFMPAIESFEGWRAFVWGMVWFFVYPMWFANPAFWLGSLRYSQGRFGQARNAAGVAMLLGVSQIWMFAHPPRIGYYVWIASMALLASASIWQDTLSVRYEAPIPSSH